MLLYIVRHGMTPWNHLHKAQGSADIPLAQEGIDLAKKTGEALLDVMKMVKGEDVAGDIPALSLAVGFMAAFVSGCVACKWMINIVK